MAKTPTGRKSLDSNIQCTSLCFQSQIKYNSNSGGSDGSNKYKGKIHKAPWTIPTVANTSRLTSVIFSPYIKCLDKIASMSMNLYIFQYERIFCTLNSISIFYNKNITKW